VHAIKLYVRSSFLAPTLDGCEWLASRPARFTPGEKVCIICRIEVLVGKPEEKRPLGRPGLDGRIILRWIFS